MNNLRLFKVTFTPASWGDDRDIILVAKDINEALKIASNYDWTIENLPDDIDPILFMELYYEGYFTITEIDMSKPDIILVSNVGG